MAWFGTLDRQGTAVVASLCFYVFTPALTFATLAASISIESISYLWPLLVNMTISSGIGLIVGRTLAWALDAPPKYRNLVVVAIAFGNVGNLPLVFVGALCGDPNAIFQKSLGDNCERLGIAYTAFDICAATFLQLTLALYLLKPKEEWMAEKNAREEKEEEEKEIAVPVDMTPSSSPLGSSALRLGSSLHKLPTISDLISAKDGTATSRVAPPSPNNNNNIADGNVQFSVHVHREIELGHTTNRLSLSEEIFGDEDAADLERLLPPRINMLEEHHQKKNSDSWEMDEMDDDSLMHSRHSIGRKKPRLLSLSSRRCLACYSVCLTWLQGVNWWAAFPLPTLAAFAGVIIGCIPFLKGLLYGPSPPLRPLAEALELLGQGLIPGAIPLLGAVLYRGPGKSQLPRRVTAGVVITRLVLQPALLTGLVVLALHFNWFNSPDPMFLLSLLLSNATPTAINMQTLTVLFNFGAEEMSQMLFFQYLFALVTLPGFIGIFLKIIDAYGV